MDTIRDAHKAIKKVVMKTLDERDYAAQETMHHLLSVKLHSSSFNVIPGSLNGSRRVCINFSGDHRDSSTNNSLIIIDIYAYHEQYDRSPIIANLTLFSLQQNLNLNCEWKVNTTSSQCNSKDVSYVLVSSQRAQFCSFLQVPAFRVQTVESDQK